MYRVTALYRAIICRFDCNLIMRSIPLIRYERLCGHPRRHRDRSWGWGDFPPQHLRLGIRGCSVECLTAVFLSELDGWDCCSA